MKNTPTWIRHPDHDAKPVHAFRLRFRENRTVNRAIEISADERYVLFLDGQRIGQGPERGDSKNWFYETQTLRLKAGPHTLVALVWALGAEAPTAQITAQRGFFLKQISDSKNSLSTGLARWESKALSGYRFSDLGGRVPAYYAVGADLEIDGTAFDWGFEKGAGRDWLPAVASETPVSEFAVHGETNPGHRLRPALLPAMVQRPWKKTRIRHAECLKKGESVGAIQPERNDSVLSAHFQKMLKGGGAVTFPAKGKWRVLIDLEDYVCGYPVLETGRGKNGSIALRWTEALYLAGDQAQKGNRDEIFSKEFHGIGDRFLPDGNRNRSFETLWWRAGRYLMVEVETGSEPLILNSLKIRETRYPLEPESRFQSAEPRLDFVHRIGIRSLQMCSHETYMDCPYYEQLMYVGDTRLEMLTHYSLTRDSRLQKKAIELFGASIDGTGLTTSRYPSSLRQTIPPFSLWWVNCIHDFFMWRDDAPFVKSLLPGMRNVLGHFLNKRNSRGLVEGTEGWNFVDWAVEWGRGIPPDGAKGVSCPINWQLVHALLAAADLEIHLGEKTLGDYYREAAHTLGKNLIRFFWDEKAGLFADDLSHRNFSEHSQCLAVLSGLLPVKLLSPIQKGLVGRTDLVRASIYFSFYLLETLRKLKAEKTWFQKLEFWYALEEQGFKTTPEAPEPSRSDCHAWGAHPVYHSYATMLGIRPAEPGFGSVLIQPFPGPLKQLKGSMVHPRGKIEVELDRRDKRGSALVILPKGLSGSFVWKGKTKRLRAGSQKIELS